MIIGFLVNPIAGMGGSVGLKGTDGNLYFEALKRGAKPVAPSKAARFLRKLIEIGFSEKLLSASGIMGCKYLEEIGYVNYECIDIPRYSGLTSSEDTKKAVKEFLKRSANLIVFVGGDGTAKDIYDVTNGKVPLLGIPSGVKMYSGCFATSPEAAAHLLKLYVEGTTGTEVTEIADADEEAIRRGIPKVRIYGYTLSLRHEYLIVPSKDFSSSGSPEEKYEVAEYFINEYLKDNELYFLGPGSTVKAVTDVLGLDKTLLGVDALYNKRIIALDLGEKELLKLLNNYGKAYIVITVIGRQGYIFGRGNQQFTPKVIRSIGGKDRIYVIATRSKMRGIKYLIVDTGDPKLDEDLSGYWRVIVGFNEEKVVKVLPACCIEKFI